MFHDRSNTQEHVLLVLRDETVLKKKGTNIRRATHRLFLVLEAGPGVPGRQGNSESTREFRIDTGHPMRCLFSFGHAGGNTSPTKDDATYATEKFGKLHHATPTAFFPPGHSVLCVYFPRQVFFLLSKSLGPLAFSSSDAKRDCGRD